MAKMRDHFDNENKDQGDLFALPDGAFGGQTYDPELDHDRLRRQVARVYALMVDHQWRTLDEISMATSDPPASVSARLRDLRKTKFGGYEVERRRRGWPAKGLFEYRLLPRL